MEKTAISIARGKVQWLINGHWTAGDRFPKRPGNLAKLAKEEGFDPAAASGVWLAEEQQVGFFTFDGKPIKGKPLAAVAARRLDRGQWPWRGLFCLGDDLWWLVVVDNAGALHPMWDVAGSQEEINQILDTRLAELAPIVHQETFDDPQGAWDWLLADEVVSRSVPTAVPVRSAQLAARKALFVVVPAGLLVVGASAGFVFWKKHQEFLAQQAAQQAAALLAQQQQQSAQQKAAEEAAMIARIQQQWQQTPRPWASMQPWSAILSACAPGPVTQDGWILTKVECSVQGAQLQIDRLWMRGKHATVLSAPPGQISPDGNSLMTSEKVALPQPISGQPVSSAQQAGLWWTGMTQAWAGVLQVKADPLQPWRPPVPPNTPPNVQQKLNPPVLWQQGRVSIVGNLIPTSWTQLTTAPGFAPEKMIIDVQPKGLQWTLEGMQYANP
jgi:type II secretory pathway pseudopilin PulG